MDRLLRGGENGLSAATYSRHTGNFLRPSTPISQSPHIQLLREYLTLGEAVFAEKHFRETAYFFNAAECIRVTGRYFHCTQENQVEEVARGFVSAFRGEISTGNPEDGYSAPGSMVRVAQIEASDCYEVLDGNHRIAINYVRGASTQMVLVSRERPRTPLQQLLLDYGWCATRGAYELYQPIESPEVQSRWPLIRQCRDRLEMMEAFLCDRSRGLPEHPSYLDVASSYGWFVHTLGAKGFDARGVEIDWAGVEIGQRVYGLRADQVTRSEAVRFLQAESRKYDVVSCFSLAHHFLLHHGSISADGLLTLLDKLTGDTLFIDMGEDHEAWFQDSLRGWNPDHIEKWLREKTTFTSISRLGTDRDNTGPFAENYGRTLFACSRDR